jgi:hypothetical protein
MTRTSRHTRGVGLALVVLVAVTAVGWLGARQIRSPAQVAADTAPPPPSNITVPVTRRRLSTEVIVRGTVRYGAPQSVVLATSALKQGVGSDIVTRAPVAQRALKAGDVALAVDGRPVFVLPGTIPMHRDLGPGARGPDVLQLERGLSRLGISPGPIDGRYDSATESAVATLYLRGGWAPFGPTAVQRDQIRTAQAAVAAARDARVTAINNAAQAGLGAKPADIVQARIEAANARDRIHDAELKKATSQAKLEQARAATSTIAATQAVAAANAQRDQAQADNDVAAKQAAVTTAQDEARAAEAKRFELAPDATLSDRIATETAIRQADQAVTQAQSDLAAAVAAANAVRVSGAADVQRAQADGAKLRRDVGVAEAEAGRAATAVTAARTAARLAARKAQAITRKPDTSTFRAVIDSAAQEERRTQGVVHELAGAAGIQVPANEILFFPNLPLRVDKVRAKRGNAVSGSVMDVTNSRLAIDSSLSVSDAKLVRVGNPVTIEETDLGVHGPGRVARVARTPGTNKVDPNRFYLGIVPTSTLRSAVGASVKLTISIKSTQGSVLAVPVSALSIGGDGRPRLQVQRRGQVRLIHVVPGLAAEGMAEVRPAGHARLSAGDLVVVGSRTGARSGIPPPTAGGP